MLFIHVVNHLRDLVFSQIHSRNLIYNACWEDPRIDRELFRFNPSSKIVMITSAGCNALDYLLDKPQVIHAVDVNPIQNALLELKMALFRKATFEALFAMFGRGRYHGAASLYDQQLRSELSPFAQKFWDRHIKIFQPGQNKKGSFYFCGTSGQVAWLVKKYFDSRQPLRRWVDQLFSAETLQAQTRAFDEIRPLLLTKTVQKLLNRHVTLALLGVPRPQRQLMSEGYPGGIAAYITDSLKQVFTRLHIRDNYFWLVYVYGEYTKDCCPNYLKKEYFPFYQEHVGRIQLHTQTLSDFLKAHPDAYTDYVLLDHQDWLASHDPEALKDEWHLIFKNSIRGTKILQRSAALQMDFLPDFVMRKLQVIDAAGWLHPQDRVGTYASIQFATVVA
jgi:S-adenosylmethionine-diacylglycerol 3-amino-3-carboxypropyl transferase